MRKIKKGMGDEDKVWEKGEKGVVHDLEIDVAALPCG